MKHIILLGDGMADEPLEELGGLTPLACARIPSMDLLASRGEPAWSRPSGTASPRAATWRT